jgi:putative transposase
VSFINAQRDRWGVEPICKTLQVAPSTYYAAVSRQPSARQVSDQQLKIEITRVHRDNFGVYGIEKVWRQLNREGQKVGRDRIARLMDDLELSGVVRGKRKRTTYPAEVSQRPADLVERNFTAAAPNRLWVSDLTYVSTWSGFVYVAFVIDVFSRFIVGWRVSNSLHADLALDALEMAIWRRQRDDLTGLIHHSDRGVQYLAIRYTERLAEAGAVGSVGSR